jgi:monofunctional glycosyltransferase
MADFRSPNPQPDQPDHHPDPATTTRPATTTQSTMQSMTPPIRTATAPAAAATIPVPRQSLFKSTAAFLRKIVRIVVLTLVASTIAILLAIIAYRWIDPPTSTLMLGQRLLGTSINNTWRPLSAVSPNLARAVIMSEDAGFCRHRGVDWRELEAAYERGQDGGNAGGGSTISMQVSKNLFLWPSRSYLRKAIEIPITMTAEALWPKARMLEIYLNIAEWGPGIFGAEAAAQTYFKKPASALNEREAALLATALPNPLTRNPRTPSDLHRRLGVNIENRMKASTSHTQCLPRTQRTP